MSDVIYHDILYPIIDSLPRIWSEIPSILHPPIEVINKDLKLRYAECIWSTIKDNTLITAGDVYRINRKIGRMYKSPEAYEFANNISNHLSSPIKSGRSWSKINVPEEVAKNIKIIKIAYIYYLHETTIYNDVNNLKVYRAYDITNLTKVIEDGIFERLSSHLDDSQSFSNYVEKVSIPTSSPQSIRIHILLYG